MNNQLDTRSVFLSVLVALLMLASAFLALAPEVSAGTTDKSDCPAGKICLWSGPTFGGQQSFWNGSETGCHALENIDPQSVYNHTGNHNATFPGLGTIVPGSSFTFSPAWTGSMCID